MKPRTGLLDTTPVKISTDFRRLWLGNSLSILGSQLTIVAVLSQVWELSESSIAVGTVGIAHAVPMVVIGLLGGALADSMDRRKLAVIATIGQTVATALLAVMAIAGLASFTLVLALVALQASFTAAGAPAKRTFVARLLPDEHVSAGIALGHVSFQASMLLGPAAAGLIIAQGGIAVCYVIDTFTFVIATYCILRLPTIRPLGDPRRQGLTAFWEGWRFIGHNAVVRGAFLTDLVATIMAMPIALLPAINDERFGGRPETLGLLISSIAVGGIVAGVVSGSVTRASRPGCVMLLAAGVWGVGLAGFGFSHDLWLAIACLASAGVADTISVISRGSIVQLATPDSYRGRVTAVEHIVGVAGPDVGNFRGGLVAGPTSVTFAMVSGGVVCAAGIAAIASTHRPLRQFRPSHVCATG